ncbi:MAG: biopolymer transporter ExbD [Parvibaculum sp.]|nr:biopolymer transporter ExbD [Parvibaculum sp.]
MFEEPIRRRGLFSLTPLIDVVFQLLLFFMLTTTFMQAQMLTVTTPAASDGGLPQDANVVEIWLMADGSTRVAEKPVTPESLGDALKAVLGGRIDLTVSIFAEKGSRTQAFVSAIEAARQAGVKNVATARVDKFKP